MNGNNFIQNVFLIPQFQSPPAEVAEDFTFLKEYCEEHGLRLDVFLRKLAVLSTLLTKAYNDEKIFWEYRYEIVFQLRYLLAGQNDLLAGPELLIECDDLVIRYIMLLTRYTNLVMDPEIIKKDPLFAQMYVDLLYAFMDLLMSNDEFVYSRCCCCVLRYTIEALLKKANQG